MKSRIRALRPLFPLVVLAVGGTLAFPAPAAAYIDPGTGSLVLQMLIAGALGAAFAVKRFWRKIVAFFRSAVKRP